MKNHLYFDSEAREKLKCGIDKLGNAVKATLGPKGRNVVIQTPYGTPHITKDGVTVAKAVKLDDPVENLGAQIVRQAASKTVDIAGDGTTTATVLAQAIISEGTKLVQAGVNPTDIKKGLYKALENTINYISTITEPIKGNKEKIKQIATISANNDIAVGELIAKAFEVIGEDGVISVEESKSTETYLEKVQGTRFDRGYVSPYFVTDPKKLTCEFENPYILIYDKKIRSTQEIVHILDICAKKAKPLVIIADEVESQALSMLVVNKMRINFPVAAIKAPAFGERRAKVLEDLAILTGATLITENSGRTLSKSTEKDLGSCEKIVISRNDTTIISGKGSKSKIDERIAQLREEIAQAETKYEMDTTKDRLASLVGGVAVLYIGAPTEIELKEKKDRVDDALHATQAALQEGIVPGGGIAYVHAAKKLDKLDFSEHESFGVNVLRNALFAPLETIVDNAGKSGTVIRHAVYNNKNVNIGYNALSDSMEPLKKAGIVDPSKVLRVALENAVSVASMVLTTDVTMCEEIQMPPQDMNLDFNGQ